MQLKLRNFNDEAPGERKNMKKELVIKKLPTNFKSMIFPKVSVFVFII